MKISSLTKIHTRLDVIFAIIHPILQLGRLLNGRRELDYHSVDLEKHLQILICPSAAAVAQRPVVALSGAQSIVRTLSV